MEWLRKTVAKLEHGVNDHERENLNQDNTVASADCDVEIDDRTWLGSLKQKMKVAAHDGSCWLPALVRKLRDQTALIHYIGWDKQFDEWLPKSLDRIRPIDSLDDLTPKPIAGARVKVKYDEDARTVEYLGTVTSVRGLNVHILYDADNERGCIDWSDPQQRGVVAILNDDVRTYSQRRCATLHVACVACSTTIAQVLIGSDCCWQAKSYRFIQSDK